MGTRPELHRLYQEPLAATRSGPLYNAVSYPTKISPEVTALFIATHTDPGDTVLDVFGGSGSTGLGALLCDRPTERMRKLCAQMSLAPLWGPRSATVYEIGQFGSLIARVMCDPPSSDEFVAAAHALATAVSSRLGWMYRTTSPSGTEGVLRHIIWSEVLACAECGAEVTYWDAAVRRGPLRLKREFQCIECSTTVPVDHCKRLIERISDPLTGGYLSRRKRVPRWVYGKSSGHHWSRPVTPADLELATRCASAPLPDTAPLAELSWGDLYRSGYHHGMTHLHHFYTARNFAVFATVWDYIQEFPVRLQDSLRLLALSYNASHATLMTRVVVKNGSGDLVVTGGQSGVLYVSGLPVEKNIVEGLRRKTGTLASAFGMVASSRSSVRVVTASSTALDLADESVDYVFTDPPFGGNIPYSEVNQVNELWMGARTDAEKEAIVSRSQGKDLNDYQRLLEEVFTEVTRVMRPEASATVVFHPAHAAVWGALTSALSEVGLSVEMTGILDKTQASFKQTVSDGSVKGDPLILLRRRPPVGRLDTPNPRDFFDLVLREARESPSAPERSVERMYSRLVARCLKHGVEVPCDAAEFYKLVRRTTPP